MESTKCIIEALSAEMYRKKSRLSDTNLNGESVMILDLDLFCVLFLELFCFSGECKVNRIVGAL